MKLAIALTLFASSALGADFSSGKLQKRVYRTGNTVAVVGAGVSGIAVVKGLIENGVPAKAITVIERDSLVGGKVRTVNFEGRPYELGAAVIIKGRYKEIEDLAARHQMTFRSLQPTKFLNVDTGAPLPDVPPTDPVMVETGNQMKFYIGQYLANWSKITEWNGFSNIPPELEVSWKDFLSGYKAKYGTGIELMNFRLSSALGGSGYVMMQNPPFAAQIMRFISPRLLQSVLAPGAVNVFNAVSGDQCVRSVRVSHPVGGFQCLWMREAQELASQGVTFKLGTEVVRIHRGAKVRMTVRRTGHAQLQKKDFDHVFYTGDLRYLAGTSGVPHRRGLLADLTSPEQKLVQSIAIYPYRSYLLKLDKFPKIGASADPNYAAIFGLLPYMKNGDDKKGVLLVRPYSDSQVFQMYAFGGREVDDQSILGGFASDMAKFGTVFDSKKDVIASAQWEYFPHVNPASGLTLSEFFNGMMERQGAGGLWYAGEVFGFGLTIDVYEQGKAIAERFVKNEL